MDYISIYLKLRKYCNFGPNILVLGKRLIIFSPSYKNQFSEHIVEIVCAEERGKRKNGSIEREVRILPSSWRVANQARGLDPRPPRPRPRRGCKGCQDRLKRGLVLKGLPTSSLKLQRWVNHDNYDQRTAYVMGGVSHLWKITL